MSVFENEEGGGCSHPPHLPYRTLKTEGGRIEYYPPLTPPFEDLDLPE